ncbi:MAG: response regulator [Chitinophagales bacterium]|nr:response regulator [Chitinophagales bacterium]
MIHSLLVVDDDIPFTTVVKDSLEKEGYKVHAVHHANAALSMLDDNSNNIEVMVLDWSMPDISGIELLKRIKKQKRFENLQVIMQTVMDSPENIQQGVEAGAFFYLVKPVKTELLHSTIRAALLDYNRNKNLLQHLRETETALHFMEEGVFRLRTVSEGDSLAALIARQCQRPEEAIYISELFANGVEHGNLGITYDEKTALIAKNQLAAEVNHRLSLRENLNKFVNVTLKRRDGKLSILIEDAGNGFYFDKFLVFDDARVFDNHGRGIAILNSLLSLHYIGKGNKVVVELPLAEHLQEQ